MSKWSQLLHFYAWDANRHQFDDRVLAQFVQKTLHPMRVLFADEVEMTGYSPTIPQLASQDILLAGTSNQYAFKQLDDKARPPEIYRFKGVDMRVGDPTDAIVTAVDPLWSLFARLRAQPPRRHEQLEYRLGQQANALLLLFDFATAVRAPLLETEWVHFLQGVYHSATGRAISESHLPFVLLFDRFSLEVLQADYNAIIRFVALFDAIEQFGLGVLLHNEAGTPQVTRAAITNLKTHIYNAIGVPEEIKQKTVVGLDRCASRLGQAGHKAHRVQLQPKI